MAKVCICIALLLLSIHSWGQTKADTVKRRLLTLPNDTNRVIALNELAFLYYNVDPDSAELFASEANLLANRLEYKRGIATSMLRIGAINSIKGDVVTAISYYEKCITLADSINDTNLLCRALLNMGITSVDLGNDFKALEYFKRARQGFEDIGNTPMSRTVEMNMGIAYSKLNDYERADSNFQNSFRKGESGHPYYGLLLINLAALRIKQQHYTEADSLLSLAWTNLRNTTNTNHKGEAQLVYARYYMAIGNLPKAQEHGLLALTYIRRLSYLTEAYETLAAIEKRMGNIPMAYTYQSLQILYKDSVQSVLSKNRARLFEIQDMERLRAIQKTESDLQQTKKTNERIIFFGSALLFTIITLTLGYSIQQKQETNKKLIDINKEISHKNNELEHSKMELTQLNKELQTRESELSAANEELTQHQEEIAAQYDAIAMQNTKLQQANELIAVQNLRISQENETLEKAVKERTKELVEYNQQLEQFAFVTAHNLRAPVARILGLGNLLQLKNSNVHEKEDITNRMIATTKELDFVIHDLNKILEVRKNNTDTYAVVNFAEELSKIKGNLKTEIDHAEATIESDFSACPTLYTIRPYIDSILYNLVGNALKYRHPKRKPLITVKTALKRNFLVLTVSDNGIGFNAEANRNKLFNLYSRFHDHVEGRGIGLFLVKTQVVALNGEISVSSTIDEGTTFTIIFRELKA